MSQLALPSPIAQSAVEPFSIWRILESVRTFVAGTFISEREHRFLGLIRPTAETIGAFLLAADDRADLDGRLETVIERPDAYRLNAQLLLDPELQRIIEIASADQPAMTWPVDLLGGAAMPHLQRVEALCIAITIARRKFADHYPQELQAELERVQLNADAALAFLSDPRIHPDIKDAILEGARADHCLLALIHVIISKQSPAPWLRVALAQRSADGYYEYLRLLASDPKLEVPPAIVPEPHRHNLAALQLEAAMTDVWVHELARGNDDVIFPFAHDDDT